MKTERTMVRQVWSVLIAVGVGAGMGSATMAQDPANGQAIIKNMPKAEEILDASVWPKINALNDSMMDKMMTDNNWNTPADQMAIRIQERLKRTSPSDLNARFDIVSEEIGQRYNLRPEQKTYVKNMMLRETAQVMIKNGGAMKDMMQQMQADKVFDQQLTPQLVQKYVQMYRPIMESGQEMIEHMNQEMHDKVLDDDQKKIHDEDWKLCRDRNETTKKMVLKWESGQWTPAEWGLPESGEIPLDGAAARRLRDRIRRNPGDNPGTEQGPAHPNPPAVVGFNKKAGTFDSTNKNEWAGFVERYIKYYGLDSAVQGSARGILAEILKRAQGPSERIAEQVGKIKTQLAQKDLAADKKADLEKQLTQLNKPMQELFNELLKRLDGLLNTEQLRKPPMPGRPVTGKTPMPASAPAN